MKIKKIWIILISVILLIIISSIIIFNIFLFSNFQKENNLKAEFDNIKEMLSKDIIDVNTINSSLNNISSDGEYAKIEHKLKEYISSNLSYYISILEISNDSKLLNILSIENITNDLPNFENTKKYLLSIKEQLNEFKKLNDEYLNNLQNDSNFNLYYSKLYEKFIKKYNLNNNDIIIDISRLIEKNEIIIEFLIKNKSKWSVENDKIVFSDVNIENEYLKLLSSDLEDYPNSTIYTKDFGSYNITEGWVESKTHSSHKKFFYIKPNTDNDKKPDNISINTGTNKYSSDQHLNFKNAILNQLNSQIAGINANITGSGFTSKNGYIVYKFTIEETDVTTTQYYIVGDYKYVLVHETVYNDKTITDIVANDIVNSFKWSK